MIQRVIVIGAGIGGLCAAIALRRVGIEAVIYEQAEAWQPVGAGLTLWANAIRALRSLGLADAVIPAGSRIERAEIRTATGRTLSRSRPGELEQRFGEPTIAIHRADLHHILLSALPADAVHLAARCVAFGQEDEGVSVHFAGGRRDRADLLVGADGIHSAIRAQLFPEVVLRYAGYAAWRGVVATSEESALGLTSESWGRGSRFGIVRIDRERVYWFATANASAGIHLTAAERKCFLQQRFRGWHSPVDLLLESTPAEAILQNDIYDVPPFQPWGRGRVILTGDAAHPTTPNLGQGACMAIESGVALARCLSRGSDVPESLRRYQAERMPRTAWITEQSRRIGRIGQLENPLACGIRDLLTRLTPAKALQKTLEKAVGSSA